MKFAPNTNFSNTLWFGPKAKFCSIKGGSEDKKVLKEGHMLYIYKGDSFISQGVHLLMSGQPYQIGGSTRKRTLGLSHVHPKQESYH